MLLRRTAMFAFSINLLAPAIAAVSLDEKVRAAYTAWDIAFGESNAEAISAMYTADALFLPPGGGVLRGPTTVEKFFNVLFADGVTGHKLELIEAHGTPDLVVAAATWSARTKDLSHAGVATHEFVQQADGSLKIRLHIFN